MHASMDTYIHASMDTHTHTRICMYITSYGLWESWLVIKLIAIMILTDQKSIGSSG